MKILILQWCATKNAEIVAVRCCAVLCDAVLISSRIINKAWDLKAFGSLVGMKQVFRQPAGVFTLFIEILRF